VLRLAFVVALALVAGGATAVPVGNATSARTGVVIVRHEPTPRTAERPAALRSWPTVAARVNAGAPPRRDDPPPHAPADYSLFQRPPPAVA
jgi:hypothetical protein